MQALIGNLNGWEIAIAVVVLFVLFGRGAPRVAGRLASRWWRTRRG